MLNDEGHEALVDDGLHLALVPRRDVRQEPHGLLQTQVNLLPEVRIRWIRIFSVSIKERIGTTS